MLFCISKSKHIDDKTHTHTKYLIHLPRCALFSACSLFMELSLDSEQTSLNNQIAANHFLAVCFLTADVSKEVLSFYRLSVKFTSFPS